MELEDKMRFALSTVRPMAEYTRPYLASVIGVVNPRTGEHVGSALRCNLGGRRAIVTARHVIQKACESRYEGFAISAGYGRPPFQVHGPITYDQAADLALYYLPADYPDDPTLAFWPTDRLDPAGDRLATDYLFVHGFPRVRSYSSQLLGGAINNSLPYGAMQRLRSEGLPTDIDDRLQFAINFDPRNIRRKGEEPADSLPDPHGLSGCPVWRIGASGQPAKDWVPDWSLLVGIVTQWRTDAQILVATRASCILEMIQQPN